MAQSPCVETEGHVQAGLPGQIRCQVVEVPVGGWQGVEATAHRGAVALPSRSANLRFFRSQYSGVTGIGSPESSPSSSRASSLTSAIRLWSARISSRTHSLTLLYPPSETRPCTEFFICSGKAMFIVSINGINLVT